MTLDRRQQKGRIFDIQRFSVHDGQGIRTIVFLKGCVLRCKWCCNPESQEYAIQTMTVQGKPKIIGKDVTVGEVMDTVLRDRPYYRRSGGGMTLSGGECMCQPDFTEALLAEAHALGIHTAIESMAGVDYKIIQRMLPHLDQYLMDIKHTNPEKHKRFTGKSNELMMQNARRVAESGLTELIIRVPLIPTFNATEGEIAEIARFASTLPGVKKLHLLPYHRLGQDKYAGLGREYEMDGILPPTQEEMERLLAVAKSASGLDCQIGG